MKANRRRISCTPRKDTVRFLCWRVQSEGKDIKKFAAVAIPLVLAVSVVGYVFLFRSPNTPAPADGFAPAPERTTIAPLPDVEPAAAEESIGSPGQAADEPPPDWETSQEGDETIFLMFGGDIGYVDVDSVVQDREPYSVVALLQKRHEQTGADESLELVIDWAGENEIWGYEARFAQLIEGQSDGRRGTIVFSSSGAVGGLSGSIVNTQSLSAGNLLILEPEAEAIALEAVSRFVKSAKEPLLISSPKMRYVLDPEDNKLRAQWQVPIVVRDPYDEIYVHVSAENGEVLKVETALVNYQAAASCTGVSFRVCDGSNAQFSTCQNTGLNPTTAILDGDDCVVADDESEEIPEECQAGSKYKAALANAQAAVELVGGYGDQFLNGVGGSDCTVDIMVGNTLLLESESAGHYSERYDTIVLRPGYESNATVVLHETLHAISKSSGEVEHGLVYAMDALEGDGVWNGPEGMDLTAVPEYLPGSNDLAMVGHAIYRVYMKVDKEKAFELSLRVDSQYPNTYARFVAAMKAGAVSMGIRSAVEAALNEVENPPSPTPIILPSPDLCQYGHWRGNWSAGEAYLSGTPYHLFPTFRPSVVHYRGRLYAAQSNYSGTRAPEELVTGQSVWTPIALGNSARQMLIANCRPR